MSNDLLQAVEGVEARLAKIKQLLEGGQSDVARLELLEVAHDLPHQALGPAEWLKVTFAVDKMDHLAYYMIDQFSIYKFVPLTGSISYADLSQQCGLLVDPLRRILRQAMLNHLFTEHEPGYVAHSETSALFVTDPKSAAWLGHNYDEVFRSLSVLPEAIRKFPGREEPGNTACAIAFNQPNGLFGGLLREEPWRAKRFEGAMQAVTQGQHDSAYLAQGYDWGKLDKGLVVDVGGSSGFQSVAVAKEFPDLSFVVQDIEDHSEQMLEHKSAAGVQSEMQFQVHDFFGPNPQQSADIYFLRHIIHDWGDENSARILKCIANVMKPSAKILIVDIVVPEPKTLPWHAHRMISFMDLQMMVMVNGKERTKGMWEELVTKAHPGLQITQITQPPNSLDSIIEISKVISEV